MTDNPTVQMEKTKVNVVRLKEKIFKLEVNYSIILFTLLFVFPSDFSVVGSKCDFESEESKEICAGWEQKTILLTTHEYINDPMFIRTNYTTAIVSVEIHI